mmetsp:Transcript_26488/g.85568  ORF Transcript_26488/g.85568 Transcript_26488/m.85568 type:complete len:251 (+) Transcript_26488:1555-2307(+)|eukprot:scaffold31179_cov101-Isochrysis_galbana.AAC.7
MAGLPFRDEAVRLRVEAHECAVDAQPVAALPDVIRVGRQGLAQDEPEQRRPELPLEAEGEVGHPSQGAEDLRLERRRAPETSASLPTPPAVGPWRNCALRFRGVKERARDGQLAAVDAFFEHSPAGTVRGAQAGTGRNHRVDDQQETVTRGAHRGHVADRVAAAVPAFPVVGAPPGSRCRERVDVVDKGGVVCSPPSCLGAGRGVGRRFNRVLKRHPGAAVGICREARRPQAEPDAHWPLASLGHSREVA